jgi:hypothetical protein
MNIGIDAPAPCRALPEELPNGFSIVKHQKKLDFALLEAGRDAFAAPDATLVRIQDMVCQQ